MAMVSVIIPVYNAEKYINECLDSLLRQTYSDFEIICVDDGSSDRSLEILHRYKQQDGRITVLSQKNQYAGAARNVGMERAKGKYLLFLDADDFFCEDMLERAVDEAEKSRTEILAFDAYLYDDVRKEIKTESWAPLSAALFGDGVKSAAKIANVLYQFATPAPWNKLFLRDHVEKNGLRFQEIKRVNDLSFTYEALSCAERIGVLNEKLLYYRIGNAQSLQGSAEDTPAAFALAAYALRDFLKNRKLWETFRTGFQDMAAVLCVRNLSKMNEEKAYAYLLETLRKDVLPCLGLDLDRPDKRLAEAVQKREKIIVYGAGMLASVFVRMLIMQYRYESGGLVVAVSDRTNNASQIWGVEVCEIKEIPDGLKDCLAVIAISDGAVQEEIGAVLWTGGFSNILKLGFRETLGLIAYGVEAEAEGNT